MPWQLVQRWHDCAGARISNGITHPLTGELMRLCAEDVSLQKRHAEWAEKLERCHEPKMSLPRAYGSAE